MNLATLPWERLEFDLGRAMRLPAGHCITEADWSAISHPLATFLHSAKNLRSAHSEKDGASLRSLAELGIDVQLLFQRLRILLPKKTVGPDMLMEILADGVLDAAAAADQWSWNGIIGVDLQLVDVEALRPVRLQGQELLRWISTLAEPPTLPEVLSKLKGQHSGCLILRWTTQTFALLPGYCARRRMPTLGRPAMTNTLRKPALPPSLVRPVAQAQPLSTVMSTSLVNDITAVISEIALQPVRHRQDWAWRIADAKRVSARLHGNLEPDGKQGMTRLSKAFDVCLMLSLTRQAGRETHVSEDGLAWLRRSVGECQHHLLEHVRRYLHPASDPMPRDSYHIFILLQRVSGLYLSAADYLKVWGHLATAWRALADSVWIRSEALAWWQQSPPQGFCHYEGTGWANLISSTLDGLAFSLGIIASNGVGESSTINLTPAGRWTLGLDPTWTPPAETNLAKPIIVQADHSIIFLAPNASVEVAIGAFTDRLPGAHGIGALFKLSKMACRRAAIAGLDAAHVVNVLTQASAKPLPTNVVRELDGWFGRLRRAIALPALLITTADEETATTLVALLGATRLGPQAVSLPHGSRPGELERRLAKENILLNTAACAIRH
jgi:hypothetical protein